MTLQHINKFIPLKVKNYLILGQIHFDKRLIKFFEDKFINYKNYSE